MTIEQLKRAKNILSGDNVERQIEDIINHDNYDEMIDYIDDVQPSSEFEYFYTVRGFIESIGMTTCYKCNKVDDETMEDFCSQCLTHK